MAKKIYLIMERDLDQHAGSHVLYAYGSKRKARRRLEWERKRDKSLEDYMYIQEIYVN